MTCQWPGLLLATAQIGFNLENFMSRALRSVVLNGLIEVGQSLTFLKTTAGLLIQSPQDGGLWRSLRREVSQIETVSQMANCPSLMPYITDLEFLLNLMDEGLLPVSGELTALVTRNIESIEGQLIALIQGTTVSSAIDSVASEIDEVLSSQLISNDWYCPSRFAASVEADEQSVVAACL